MGTEARSSEGEPPWRDKYVPVLRVVLILLALYLSSLYSYLLFHSLVEVFSVIVAIGIFLLVWSLRRLDNNYVLLIRDKEDINENF